MAKNPFGKQTKESRQKSELNRILQLTKQGMAQIASGQEDFASSNKLTEAFHRAAAAGFHELVHAFIKSKIQVDRKNDANQTALMRAAQKGHEKVVEDLITAGADVGLVDANSQTALKLVAIEIGMGLNPSKDYEGIVRALILAGADEADLYHSETKYEMNLPDEIKKTALEAVETRNSKLTIESIVQQVEKILEPPRI